MFKIRFRFILLIMIALLIVLQHYNYSARKIFLLFSEEKILKFDNLFETNGELFKYRLVCEGQLVALYLIPKTPLLDNKENIAKMRTIESNINIYFDFELVLQYENLKHSILIKMKNKELYIRGLVFKEIFLAPGFFCGDLVFEVSVQNPTDIDFSLVISESNNL